jgi:hypothetical protein
LVDRLASFRPTHVAVEWETGEQAKLDQRYADYLAGRIKLDSDETDQIGLRLAKLGLSRVDAVDWNQEPPGKDDDYDFPGWLKSHGRGAEWEHYQATAQRQADAEGAFSGATRSRIGSVASTMKLDHRSSRSPTSTSRLSATTKQSRRRMGGSLVCAQLANL